MTKSKRILSVDFDGTLHYYTSPWKGPTHIPDPPSPGALDFLRAASERFTVVIFSSRSQSLGAIEAMRSWLVAYAQLENAERVAKGLAPHSTAWISDIGWPTAKPPAYLTIDDRCFCFEGTWPSVEQIENFLPWNRRQA
jgi:hypothetical protein